MFGYRRPMKLSPRYDGPSILTIEGHDDPPGVTVRRQRRRLETLLADLSEDEWRHESRCDGWSIQDVVAHLVGVNTFWQASVSAGLAGTPTQVLAAFDPAAHPPLMIEPMRALAPRARSSNSSCNRTTAFSTRFPMTSRGWSAVAESPAGHVSIDHLAHHTLWDSWIHERDIAIPIGHKTVNEPDELGISLRYAAAIGPALTIGASGTRTPARWRSRRPTPTSSSRSTSGMRSRSGATSSMSAHRACSGTAADLIEALSIRSPLPEGTPDEWHVLAHGLATVFDTEFEIARRESRSR